MPSDIPIEACRSSELPTNLNSHKLISELQKLISALEESAVKNTMLPKHVLSPDTAIIWYWTLHTQSQIYKRKARIVL